MLFVPGAAETGGEEHGNSESRLDGLEDQIIDLEAKISDLECDKFHLEKINSDLKSCLERLELTLRETEAKASAANTTRISDDAITNAHQQVGEMKLRIMELEENVRETERKLRDAERNQEREMKEKDKSLEEMENKIKKLIKQVDKYKKKIKELSEYKQRLPHVLWVPFSIILSAKMLAPCQLYK